jgi:hypothetical protein
MRAFAALVIALNLAVWRINPAVVAYTGAMHDAAQAIAGFTAVPTCRLALPRATSETRKQLLAQRAVMAQLQPPPPEAQVPIPKAQRTTSGDPTLDKAQTYVTKFVETFASVMWREQSTQEDRTRRQFNASGTRFLTLRAKRNIVADMLFLWLDRESKWIAVRDVMSVDGVPLQDQDRPAASAFNRRELSINDLKGLAALNGRFDIGQIVHTFNEPTLAMLFLTARERHRFSFSRPKDERLTGRSVFTYEYKEVVHPTYVQDHARDVPASGKVWLDRSSSAVLQTLLELTDPEAGLKGQITIRYGTALNFDVLVPVEMREVYSSAAGEEITTTATYSDFRRFETAARIVGAR